MVLVRCWGRVLVGRPMDVIKVFAGFVRIHSQFCCLFFILNLVSLFCVKAEGTVKDQTHRMWVAGPAESPVQR